MYKKRLKRNDIESGRSVIPRESDRSGQERKKETKQSALSARVRVLYSSSNVREKVKSATLLTHHRHTPRPPSDRDPQQL